MLGDESFSIRSGTDLYWIFQSVSELLVCVRFVFRLQLNRSTIHVLALGQPQDYDILKDMLPKVSSTSYFLASPCEQVPTHYKVCYTTCVLASAN